MKAHLNSKFHIKDLRTPPLFFGTDIDWKVAKQISLTQTKLFEKMLGINDMVSAKSGESPASPAITVEDIIRLEPLFNDEKQRYRNIVGSSVYFAVDGCPDICFAASMLSDSVKSSTRFALITTQIAL